jgi:chromosome partitioning protein
MKIITVTGYKGGVGKSTTAIHLATYLSDQGKVVLVDSDPNRSAKKWSERGKGTCPFIVADERQAMKIVNEADYVVIDTPARPNSDDIGELAKGCELIILPTAPDILCLEPLLEIAQEIKEAKYKALLTVVPPYPSKDGQIMRDDLIEGGVPVFETMVRRTAGFPKAALQGVPVRDMENIRFKEAWDDYKLIGDEVMQIIK